MASERPAAMSLTGDGETRVAGRVESGVEHGSVVLRGDDGTRWQLGPRWSHLVGRDVLVRGTPAPHLLTTAQQGTPLLPRAVTTPDGQPLTPLAGGGDPRGV